MLWTEVVKCPVHFLLNLLVFQISAFSPKSFGFPDSWGKWGQMCKTSTAILMCIIPIALIKYVTIRQTIHTQHSMIVIQKAARDNHYQTCSHYGHNDWKLMVVHSEYQTCFYYWVGWACSSPQWSTSVDVCVTKIDSLCILWISHYTVYQ